MTADWTPPEYLSPSQINSLLTCGEQYRLVRVVGAPERPQWASVGGTAVHELTELLDRHGETPGIKQIEGLWPEWWEKSLEETRERNPDFDSSTYYTAGGKSRARPKKEGPEWWTIHGPKFVASWVQWRKHTDLELWQVCNPDTGEVEPAIEVEVWANMGQASVRSIIDRIFVDPEGQLRIVDLKSGMWTQQWPQQLALNALGVRGTYHESVKWGGFWKGRQGGVSHWFDLEGYTDAWLWTQVWRAKQIRDQQLFVAQPSMLCETACGVREWCVAMGAKPHPDDPDATLTHNGSDE